MSDQNIEEQVDFDTFKRVLFAKDSAYKSYRTVDLQKMYDNKHPASLVANQQALAEASSKSSPQSSTPDSPAIVKFLYFLMVADFIAGAAGIIKVVSDNPDDPDRQLGVYLTIAGICGGISCIVGAVFFTMLGELVYHFRKIHEILKKKNT